MSFFAQRAGKEHMLKEYTIKGNYMEYVMPKEIDHHMAQQIYTRIDQLIDMYQIRTLCFDFSQTEFMDSSGIGILIGRSRKLHYYGGQVCAKGLKDRAEKIFRASGLYQIIKIVGEENDGNKE